MTPASRVSLGVIVGVKGLRGEVRIKSFTEVPEDVAAYGPLFTDDGRSFKLTVTGTAQGAVTARIKGVADRNAAESLRGLTLYVNRAALPAPEAGAFYQADLIGFAVELAGGEKLGKVVAFHNFGGGDVVEISGADGKGHMLPFSAAAIGGVDTTARKITVNPLSGLFESETDADERRNEQEENET